LIAQQGAAGFYEGKTAEAIVAISREKGGAMTLADLKDYKAEWVDPISTTYRGWTVYELPPNTQGIAALIMLNLMERYPLSDYGFQSPQTMHVMIEAKKLAYADMLRYVADPHFSNVPVTPLLSKPHAQERARLIDPRKAACSVEPSRLTGLTTSNGGDTIYLSVIDRDGNIVSLISESLLLVRQRRRCAGHRRHAAQSRRALHARERPPESARRPQASAHDALPAFMSRGDVQIGFGIRAASTRRRRTRSSSPTSPISGSTYRRRSRRGGSRRAPSAAAIVDVEALVAEKPQRAR
jgi:gamma-glutamyltranspeptidase/glutathione hydrolase